MNIARNLAIGITSAFIWPYVLPTNAQTTSQSGFEQATAILDTSVLFAIGAREADQEIRGAFGWPTFQEGFVEGVYFRFDPDGYARFSPSPRLDEDVFEVTCAKASTACIAKKGVLQVGLTPAGEIQIKIDGITTQDSYFISDRKSELQLPASILEPLEPRLEALLSGGGELIVKRELEVIQKISLVGFSATTTFLRWVAQQQSPRVFPRGWPVPAQSLTQTAVSLTQPNQWSTTGQAPKSALTTWQIQQNLKNKALPLSPYQQREAQNLMGQRQIPPAQFQNNGGQFRQDENIGNLQKQILDLQDRLRTMADSSYPDNRYSQRGNDPAGNPVDELEYGQAFAQQANGRNLPELPGDLGVGGDAILKETSNISGTFPGQTVNNRVGTAFRTQQPEPVDAYQALSNRMDVLEQSIVSLQRNISYQITQIKSEMANGNNSQTVGPISTLGIPAPAASNSQTQSLNEGGVSDQNQLLSKLEKRLLKRLSSENHSVVPENEAAVQSSDTVSFDRNLVEDILNELDATTPANPKEQVEETDQAKENDDFVTLNSYINQILKSDSQEN